MSTIAEFTVPARAFILRTVVEEESDLTVEVVRMVTGNGTDVTPYFWLVGEDFSTVDRSLADDPSVRSYELLEDNDAERLYRATWEDQYDSALVGMADLDATVLEASAPDDEWKIRMLFSDHESLSEFNDYTTTYDLSFELCRLYRPSESQPNGHYGVTEEQKEALVTANERGYFAVPRETNQADVASELGISENACSARLRRGHEALISHTLGTNSIDGF